MEGRQISHFRIVEKLGGGGMGVVYKAQDERLSRWVALKFLPLSLADSQEDRVRLEREASAASALDHPNICTIYEIDETEDGQLYIAMAFYEGETLKKKIKRDVLSFDESLRIALQTAEGLAAAHHQGIVHRDIKPANLMVTHGGTVKIVDFGLAKREGQTRITRTNAVMGTPIYMSPEQLLGEEVDRRTDVWALGVVLYQMLSGELPFADTDQATVPAVLNAAPHPLSHYVDNVPEELQELLSCALERDPQKRFQDAEAMAQALRRLRENLGFTTTATTVTEIWQPPKEHRFPGRRLAQVSAAILLIVVLGLWLGLKLFNGPPSSQINNPQAKTFFEQAGDYERRGDLRAHLENAESLYRRALELEPANPHIEAHLAGLLLRLDLTYPEPGRIEESRDFSRSALAAAPDLHCSWVSAGQIDLSDESLEEAEVKAREAIKRMPDDSRAHVLLGEVLMANRQPDEGLTVLRQATEMEDGHIWARPTLARILMNLGRDEEAIVEYQEALKYLPDSPNALSNLGAIYARKGRFEDAERLLLRLLETQPDELAWMNLGVVYFYQGRMQDAIEAYLQAHDMEPGDPLIQANIGEAYEEIGDQASAQLWYEKAVKTYDGQFEIRPPSAEDLADRAFYAAKAGRPDEAIAGIVEALTAAKNDQLQPDSLVLFQAAKIYALAGRRRESLSFAQQAIIAGYPIEQFEYEPAFDSLRDDSEFQVLITAEADGS